MPAAAAQPNPGLVYPDVVRGFRLVEPAKQYDKRTVFGPIDGAAEQYLRYHFVRLYRGEYAQEGERVVADVYELGSSADAFGVQSAFRLNQAVGVGQEGYVADGLLVFWRGPYFCRLAGKGVSREALKQIGSALSNAMAVRGPKPDMVALLDGIAPKPRSTYFCHAVEDLTPLLYLSTSNVLGLDLDTNCLVAKLGEGKTPVTLLVVRYPTAEGARKGLAGLLPVALPHGTGKAGVTVGEWQPGLYAGATATEAGKHGWLVGVFDARSPEVCRKLITTAAGEVARATQAAGGVPGAAGMGRIQ